MSLSFIEINQTYLKNNIDTILRISSKKTVGFVVKANAYGHGITTIVPLLQKLIQKHHYLCTITIEEAQEVRASGWTGKILIIGHIQPSKITSAYKLDTEVTIYSYKYLQSIISHLDPKQTLKAHIKVDTGMHRLGMDFDELKISITDIKKHTNINIVGIYSHYFDASSEDKLNIDKQNKYFKTCIDYVKQDYPHIIIHIDSSGSIHTTSANTMIRTGSLLYGLYKSETHRQHLETTNPWAKFRQTLSWKAPVIHTKEITHSENGVGYAPRLPRYKPQKIAIIPVGYSDGYPQQLSNHTTYIKVNATEYAPICSIVSMNYITIDISDIKEPITEVIITSDDSKISLEQLGKSINIKSFSFASMISSSIDRTCA